MGKFFTNNLLIIIGTVILLFVVFAFIAPIAAHLGWDWLAKPIYFVYQFLCHQRPWRSIHLFDHQVAFCARDTFIYLGLGISAYLVHFLKLKPLKWYVAIILTLPIAFDGGIQTVGEYISLSSDNPIFFYASTNFLRILTGGLFGLAIGFLLFGVLYETLLDDLGKKIPEQKWTKTPLVLLFSYFGLIILYVIIVQFWNITSTNYKPLSMPFDHIRIFPGVNYEYVDRAGHGCKTDKCS